MPMRARPTAASNAPPTSTSRLHCTSSATHRSLSSHRFRLILSSSTAPSSHGLCGSGSPSWGNASFALVYPEPETSRSGRLRVGIGYKGSMSPGNWLAEVVPNLASTDDFLLPVCIYTRPPPPLPCLYAPSQNELASFMSSHIPEYSTPAALQLRSASAHHASVPFANQSGKTYACEEGSDEASSPDGQYAVRAGALRLG
ncbi:hypothetical protein HETIRDRAFT_436981 [Heterobasidion irregulare TC 32-1]|uniref:Uncharacterized protein n=1 Tax=Heterobasidion irregulare (strain TC 32-1) TaxID=747525 RepID=W4JNG5_HETIT|nr:uncharacterized protein HETIRDRAFT_436981 [Heterobasidion irregulare TC 32-1]ETW75083.1 hypothetical protein HETIRDRAFT_436981 [Heterobasidion irregulare TC 32-1]